MFKMTSGNGQPNNPLDTESRGSASAPHRPAKRNYGRIHAFPLPVRVFPLPTLVPHNPLSVLSVVLSYLIQSIFPPSSHPPCLYRGYFSAETRSVHVTDPVTIRVLWEMGFFGKGSLSRSEPSWLDKEKRRRGLLAQETSEEVTRRRRQERKDFKNERARKERDAIEEKLRAEGKLGPVGGQSPNSSHDTNVAVSDMQVIIEGSNAGPDGGVVRSIDQTASPLANGGAIVRRTSANEVALEQTSNSSRAERTDKQSIGLAGSEAESLGNGSLNTIQDLEHLQLTLEEAFFLVYGLGVLEVVGEEAFEAIPTPSLLSLFRRYYYFPPSTPPPSALDDHFMISYVVYHHFRSLGWVVRPGIKFAVDYLLYNRGPVFAHAEFAVMIMPSYDGTHGSQSQCQRRADGGGRDWWWLHCVNRVQAQVQKNLVLVYVEIPPAERPTDGGERDITALLKRYKVREMALKRWTPNRSRD